jgi:hypothetical protein
VVGKKQRAEAERVNGGKDYRRLAVNEITLLHHKPGAHDYRHEQDKEY